MLSVASTTIPKICRRAATTWTQSPEYQYLQRSELGTMHFQRSLPRLPIPLLEKSCQRFLAAVEPLQQDQRQQVELQAQVDAFRQGVGMELHALLKAHDAANKHTSYISQPWFDMYLSDRAALPLNYNPLLVMKPDPRPEYQDQLLRASNLVISSLRFWRSLQSGQLAPEVYHMNPRKTDTKDFRKWMRLAPKMIATYCAYALKAYPLDMSQYERLFGVSRVPVVGKDRLVQFATSRHVLVMRRGNLYTLQVLDAEGAIVAPQLIYARLKAIEAMDRQRPAAAVPLGALTGIDRDSWAKTRDHLEHQLSAANKASLEQIDSALFCLCLDTADEPVYDEANPVQLFKHLLAGVGTNRWFDKSVSLIVSADGTASINFEHSWGDGVAVLRYFNEIYKASIDEPFIHPESAKAPQQETGADDIQTLSFDFDAQVRAAVDGAVVRNRAVDESLDMNMLRYPHLNKHVCKRAGISPDALMQLSLQLAYRLVFGDYVGTYESCSTAAFRHGRTETMRPCTVATKQFCESAMLSDAKRPDAAAMRALLRQCSVAHGQLTRDAAMGQGFDRHLFALKHMASVHGKALPALYSSAEYAKINHNIISTSTLSSDALLVGSFGPVVQDGLGIGYSIQNAECGAIVTSYKSGRDGKKFIDGLAETFERLHSVLSAK